jgi:hypothetical protein
MLSMREEMLREFTAAPEVNIDEGIITKIEAACNVRGSRVLFYLLERGKRKTILVGTC